MNADEVYAMLTQNVVKDAVITTGGWDTHPTDLDKIKDPDLTTSAGTGITEITASGGTFGNIIFDLVREPEKPVEIGIKIGLWASAGRITMYIEQGQEHPPSTWESITIFAHAFDRKTEYIPPLQKVVITKRWFRLRFYLTTAGIANVKLYNVYGTLQHI